MFIGHFGVGLLIIALYPHIFNNGIGLFEAYLIIINSYILDWDLLLPTKRGTAHHHILPTHTPIFAFAVLILEVIIFKSFLSTLGIFLAGFALLFHLVLDDISYWLKESPIPQIFWFYPFDRRRKGTIERIDKKFVGLTKKQTLSFYLTCKKTVFLEFAFVFLGIVSFFATH